VLLGAAALVPIAAAGHAAAVEPGTARAIAVDALHVAAAGLWVGGLVPLAMLLRAAATPEGADARPYAVLAARRFSRVALATVAGVAALGLTPPAGHDAPVWPFAIRLSTAALEGAPSEATRALIGSQIAVLGLAGLVAAAVLRSRMLPLGALGLVALGAGAGLALPPLAIDAYPTTYLRPSVPYQAASVASGAALYRESCVACHGARGAGDG